MFVVSLKPRRAKAMLVFLLTAVAIAAALLIFGNQKAEEASRNEAADVTAETNSQRIAYLKTFGWEVPEEACEIAEVAIPAEFDDVYREYNKIQKKQGFNLEDYRGQKAKRYTYEILNYPNETKGVRANLLVCDGKIIGGDVCSLKLDGFMHGFRLETES